MMTFDKIETHKKAMVNINGEFSRADRYKLLKMIDLFVEEKNYTEEELKKIQYMFYSYCSNGVKEELVIKNNEDSYYKEGAISYKKIEGKEYLETYKKLMLLDKKRKTSLWSERFLYIFNYHEETRQFLIENKYNLAKLEAEAWKYLNKNTMTLEQAIEEEKTEILRIKNMFPTYLKNIEWSKMQMNTHLKVALAIDCEYDLNQQQIMEYFILIKPNSILSKNESLEKKVTHFAKILSQSSFFKNNITKYKDLKDSLGKNFGVSMKGIVEYSEELTSMQKFIFLLANNPIIKHDNMKNKLEKKEKITHFGKPFLNKVEEVEYSKIKEQRSIQTKVKKTKI